jgi:hypothetical protein
MALDLFDRPMHSNNSASEVSEFYHEEEVESLSKTPVFSPVEAEQLQQVCVRRCWC